MDYFHSLFGLASCLSLPERGIVTIYGAGGKTSVMETLTREVTAQGKTVIQTTTTKIFRPEGVPVVVGEDFKVVAAQLSAGVASCGLAVLGATLTPENKLSGIDPAWPEALLESHVADYVIVEADGSARKPIKGYAPYEPVFPTHSDLLIPLLGVEAIGRPVNPDNVHRSDAFCKLTGAQPDKPLTVSHFIRCLQHMISLGQTGTPNTPIIPMINKVDLVSGPGQIQEIIAGFPQAPGFILFTSLKNDHPVRFVYRGATKEQSFGFSVVVLAAGGSVRMGRSKLTLEIQGKTLLENALLPIRQAGIRDVVVVLSEENEALKAKIPQEYHVVINRHSREGISTSLKSGLAAVDPCSQGVFFALGDQPFVGAEVYRKLIEQHCRYLPLVTWPVYGGKRGNPVLFDRRLWPDLMKTEGDEGGKQIIAGIPETKIGRVDVGDAGVLIDIDTQDEYEKYRTKETP
ncbi:MAG: putative selenium-dependent hydroxylase accessory protein YqeC [Syntrophaceae bacterium]|nr:putative selenium-dependent hydroxylase accessory protein YqeC [Syntrophaceae bacterium]